MLPSLLFLAGRLPPMSTESPLGSPRRDVRAHLSTRSNHRHPEVGHYIRCMHVAGLLWLRYTGRSIALVCMQLCLIQLSDLLVSVGTDSFTWCPIRESTSGLRVDFFFFVLCFLLLRSFELVLFCLRFIFTDFFSFLFSFFYFFLFLRVWVCMGVHFRARCVSIRPWLELLV